MDLFLGICTLVGLFVVSMFLLKVFGKVFCWILCGAAALVSVFVMGSFALAAVCLVAVGIACLFALAM